MPEPKQTSSHSIHSYHLIPRTLTFITNNNHILLIKGAPTRATFPNLYNGIGGHVERGENVEQAALREIWEETGLTQIDNLRLHGTITVDTGQPTGIILFIFSGTSTTREVRPSSEGDLNWVPISAIPTLQCVDDLNDLLTQISNMSTLDPPFHSHYLHKQP
jgi:8-oxo-dGTP diphosphatase